MRALLSAALLAALWSVGPLEAAEVRFASYSDVQKAYEAQTAEISNLRARLASLESTMEYCDDCQQPCDECCAPSCCCACGRSSGIVVGGELAFLKPHAAQGFSGFWGTDIRFGFETAPRVWLGYSDSSGLGVRARWFGFDHMAFAEADDNYSESVDLCLSVLDLEITAATQLGCNWDATVSGGLRQVDFANAVTLYNQDGVTQQSVGIAGGNIGMVLGAELRRHFLQHLSVFALGRGSVVFGDQGFRYSGTEHTDYVMYDTQKYIWESQLGLAWSRCLCGGGELFVRGAAEVQYWDTYTLHGDALSLGGFTVAVGIAR
jgi:hypothetical protein